MILTVEIISVKKQLSPKKSNLFEMVVHSEVIKIESKKTHKVMLFVVPKLCGEWTNNNA